jgi:hypothetical protein
MNPLVRDLYKRFLIAGRTYPQGLSYVRDKVKEKFFQNRSIDVNSIEFKQCIKYGRYMAREVQATGQFHKYRAMKQRYDRPEHET